MPLQIPLILISELLQSTQSLLSLSKTTGIRLRFHIRQLLIKQTQISGLILCLYSIRIAINTRRLPQHFFTKCQAIQGLLISTSGICFFYYPQTAIIDLLIGSLYSLPIFKRNTKIHLSAADDFHLLHGSIQLSVPAYLLDLYQVHLIPALQCDVQFFWIQNLHSE